MARGRTNSRFRLRLMAALLLLMLIAGAGGWWHLRHWQPDKARFPEQGAEIGSADGLVDWRALKAVGADFVYLHASASAFARDPAFVKNLDGAREAGLKVGAIHGFDPCQPAERQAGNFVTVVPRDKALLPPAVELEVLGDDCPVAISDAAIESELTTLLNQIETHTGKPALLKLGRGFQNRYGMAAAVDRNLWLTRDRFEPGYGGRPWMLWTANSGLTGEAAATPLRWVAVQP